MKQKGFRLFIKRLFDYIVGLLLLILSSPFFLIAVLIVKFASPKGSVLFKQKRIGRNNKPIIIYKLRTMTNDRDEDGNLLPDELRLKKWGKFLRRTNLDEIPQIWNVIKNEMSLIGPRPLLEKEMVVMNADEQQKRQSVFPGITGWEAVNEGKSSGRREMALLDLYYVENWSMGLDLKILFKTVFIVFGNRRPDDSVRAPKIENEANAFENSVIEDTEKIQFEDNDSISSDGP